MKKKTMRQLLSGVMAAVLLLGNLSISAGAASADPAPVPLTEPKIELQGNVVKDQFGKLTGFFELSIRVQTMTNQTMKSIMMALEYDPTVLEPVTWDAAANEAGLVPTISLGSGDYTTQLPAKKMDNTTGAVALTGAAQGAGAKGTQGKSLLYFRAESQKSVELSQMTTLAVIRFHIEKTEMAKFTLSDDGKLQYDGADGVLTKFVNFAPDAAAADSPALRTLHCSCNDKEYALAAADKFAVLSPDSVSLTLVSEESFVKTGIDLNKVCVITYTDWDNSILGTQVVPQNADVRKMVNDYVKTNFIHTDLQSNTNYASLARTDSYRGKYPHTGPAPLGTQTDTVNDGAAYALTNKLDYTFFKRVMVKDETNPTIPIWEQDDVTPYDTAYPYTHGWALCASSGDAKNTWTTLGATGELSDYAVSTTDGASFTYNGAQKFEIADFKNGLNTNSVYVKAIYEPGKDLKKDVVYTIVDGPSYERLTYSASTSGGGATYAVNYQYERISIQTNTIFGVSRTREPVVQVQFYPDIASQGVKKGTIDPFYMESPINNTDTMDVELTPAAAIVSMDCVLVDKYGSNFMIGSKRSNNGEDKEIRIIDNFDYEHFKFESRQGTNGFVYTSTASTLLEEGLKEKKGEANSFNTHWQLDTVNDLNIRKNTAGDVFTIYDISAAKTTFIQMITDAQDVHGYTDQQVKKITWHEIQYYFLNKVFVDEGTAQAIKYMWCRQNDGCVDAQVTIVTDLDTLLKASYEASLGSLDSLNTLLSLDLVNNGPMYLRADENGTAFQDLSTFKNQMIALVTNAGKADLTWAQVQYALLHGNQLAAAGEDTLAFNNDYWWYQGKTKILDWDGLISAVQDATVSGRDAVLNTANVSYLVTVTHNLAVSTTGNPVTIATPYTQAEFNQLKTDLKRAIGLSPIAGIQTPSWDQIQYFLLNGNYDPNVDMDNYGMKNYWWYDQGKIVTDIATLLDAARKANQGRTAALDQVTIAQISQAPFRLRKSFDGVAYVDSELDDFKTLIIKVPTAIKNWEQLQYFLIHGVFDQDGTNTEAYAYYWWKTLDVPAAPNIYSDADSFVKAAFLSLYNGNTVAWQKLSTSIIDDTNFRNPTLAQLPGIEYFNDLPKFTDEEVFAAQIEALVSAILKDLPHAHAPPQLSWYDVQHYLITGEYPSSLDQATMEQTYWWREGKNSPNAKSNFDKLLGYMVEFKTTAIDINAFKALITVDFLTASDMAFRPDPSSVTFTSRQLTTAKNSLVTLTNNSGVADIPNLTWENVQYALLNGGATGTDDYAWNPYKMGTRLLLNIADSTEPTTTETVQITTSEDGLTETTVTTQVITDLQKYTITTAIATTIKTEQENGTLTITTISTTVTDLLTGESVTTVGETSVSFVDKAPEQVPAEPPMEESKPEQTPDTGDSTGDMDAENVPEAEEKPENKPETIPPDEGEQSGGTTEGGTADTGENNNENQVEEDALQSEHTPPKPDTGQAEEVTVMPRFVAGKLTMSIFRTSHNITLYKSKEVHGKWKGLYPFRGIRNEQVISLTWIKPAQIGGRTG